jgi:hypothetical protein
MSQADPRVSRCRHCCSYELQGRRGGHCQQLNVNVQGGWNACALAKPLFAVASDQIVAAPAADNQTVIASGVDRAHIERAAMDLADCPSNLDSSPMERVAIESVVLDCVGLECLTPDRGSRDRMGLDGFVAFEELSMNLSLRPSLPEAELASSEYPDFR